MPEIGIKLIKIAFKKNVCAVEKCFAFLKSARKILSEKHIFIWSSKCMLISVIFYNLLFNNYARRNGRLASSLTSYFHTICMRRLYTLLFELIYWSQHTLSWRNIAPEVHIFQNNGNAPNDRKFQLAKFCRQFEDFVVKNNWAI